MSESDSLTRKGSGGLVKRLVVIAGLVIAAILAFKVTLWVAKWAIWIAAFSIIGWVVYSLFKSKDKTESAPAELDSDRRSSAGEDPMGDIEATLRELEELKRSRTR